MEAMNRDDSRLNAVEEGMRKMQLDYVSSHSLITQLEKTLQDLSTAFKEISVTTIKTQSTMESLQKEIERGNKKMDSLTRFVEDIEKVKGSVNLLDQREETHYEAVKNKIDSLDKKLDEHLDEFKIHENQSKIDVIALAVRGGGWLLSVILGMALLWSLFGKDFIGTP